MLKTNAQIAILIFTNIYLKVGYGKYPEKLNFTNKEMCSPEISIWDRTTGVYCIQ